ncbi:MAG: hypothetical protein JWN70_6742 [Planctomycetaceae bacterium]|nr:hypothetical protein [Planctomycetaceae bacterium]
MAIDIDSEDLIPLSEFNDNWPGKGVSPQALHRYTFKGIKVHGVDHPVKLDTILLSRIRYTSLEAIKRFIAAQNPTQKATVSKGQRDRETAAALHELAHR